MPVVTRAKSGNQKGEAHNLRGNESDALKKLSPALYKKLKPLPSAKQWYIKQGYEWPVCCTVKNCKNLMVGWEVKVKGKVAAIAEVGAHVFLEGDKHKILLLPTCQACNMSTRESLQYVGIPVYFCELTDEELTILEKAAAMRDEPKPDESEKEKREQDKAKTVARNNGRKKKAAAAAADEEPPLCGARCKTKKSPCKNNKGTCPHHKK